MKVHLKTFGLALGATLLILPAVRAEDGSAPGPNRARMENRRQEMGGRIGEKLGLSEEQMTKMKELGQQQKAELQALHESTAPVMKAQREKFAAIQKSYMDKRQALMTPEQREKAKHLRGKMSHRRGAWNKKHHGKHGRRGHHGGPGHREKSEISTDKN